ncbi:hypothetical protein UREG_07187 [Uncinocarpus reesii 1704]|uniref:C2H2-type domain-containing protein n=1 Tax=Uncinocarpus reesii (strain UAMH 1704) TaxID=336963 RepID=C4JYD6_UNCRE|nr:uncharacterized protein UREG_07187 [Uncinocarpus reesii 1704]EEP82322.1 hypothetical protein UREG_07187 [Uncinocarpus reesii 1704]
MDPFHSKAQFYMAMSNAVDHLQDDPPNTSRAGHNFPSHLGLCSQGSILVFATILQVPTFGGERICSAIGTLIRSTRVPDHKMGPFENEKEMCEYLLAPASMHTFKTREEYNAVVQRAEELQERPHQITFTHGDFKAHNILVDEDGHLAGFLDWESAGWCPEYWEFTTAMSPDSSPEVARFKLSNALSHIQKMSDSQAKKSAYGTPSSDTAFRKTWDREAYAEKAAADEAKAKAESKARYEAKLLGKKYYAPVDYSTLEATTSRARRLDVASLVGKTTIVPAGAAVGKRGRGAGFYCADCDLTFKDNIQLVEHLNSKQHLIATGQSGEVVRAGVEDVRQRLRWLSHKRRMDAEEEKKAGELDLNQRLKTREEEEEKEREERRRKRNEKRRKNGKEGQNGIKQEDSWEGRLGVIA